MLAKQLMSALNHGPLGPRELGQAQDILGVLAATTREQVEQALQQAKANGVDMHKLGTLAFFSEHKKACDALCYLFNIKIEDYTTTGGEWWNTSKHTRYPLLASLCQARDETQARLNQQLMARALAWGADPHATWDREGAHTLGRKTMSWMGEAISGLHLETVERLLDASKQGLDADETERRMVALWGGAHQIGSYTSRHDPNGQAIFRAIFEKFAPGQRWALHGSYWDIAGKVHPLGLEMAQEFANQYSFGNRDAIAQFKDWVQSSAKSADCRKVLEQELATSNGGAVFSQWCIDKIYPDDAREVLINGLHKGVYAILSSIKQDDLQSNTAKVRERCHWEFDSLLGLEKRALAGGPQGARICPILCRLPDDTFLRLTPLALENLVDLWPFVGNRNDLVNETAGLLDALREEHKTEEARREALLALKARMQLNENTPNAPSVPKVRL